MKPELLAPAGGYEAALAAFQYGADAIYVGLHRFSARADADNLTPERLRVLLAYARSFTPAKKIYVTFNTLVSDADLPAALALLADLEALSPDGVIVQDLGVARLIRDFFPSLELHASTQLAAHNLDGVQALKELGFKRVVLARELSCEEIKRIVSSSGVEVEVFVHGALCYSYSGLCLFSAMMHERSGNRGRCAYCCREGFLCEDERKTRYPFSMKDLALAPVLEQVVATGAHALKIEGRMKSALYVACLSDYYRKKLDNRLSPQAERQMIQDVQTVFSRPWTTLYATGREQGPESIIDPVAIGHRGAFVGTSEAVLSDGANIRWLRFKTNRALEKHDGLQVELAEGGKPFGFAVSQMRLTGRPPTVISAPAGASVEVALPQEAAPFIPRGTSIFCSASQAVRRSYEIHSIRESELSVGTAVDFDVTLSAGGMRVVATPSRVVKREGVEDVQQAEIFLPLALEKAQQPERTEGAVRKAFERLGESGWTFGKLRLSDPDGCYAPPSKLNEARRTVLAVLDELEARMRAERVAHVGQAIAALEGEAVPCRQSHVDGGAAAVSPSEGGGAGRGMTLKVRCASAILDDARQLERVRARFDRLVLFIGHDPVGQVSQRIAAWQAACPRLELGLALPLVSREAERQTLQATVRQLIQEGWKTWECADLAGWRLLKACGIEAMSADWTLYAFNRLSVAELARLGIVSFVLSPECDMQNLCALAGGTIPSEGLVCQHVPLFISETPPCVEGAEEKGMLTFKGRRGHTFVSHLCDGCWVTVHQEPVMLGDQGAEMPFSRRRVDLSWSPGGGSKVLEALLGRP